MKEIIKKNKFIFGTLLFVFFLCRVCSIVLILKDHHIITGFDTTVLQIFDIVYSIILIIYLYNILDIQLKYKNQKSRLHKGIIGIIILIALFLEYFISNFYYFQTPLQVCNYYEICNIESLLLYEKDDKSFFVGDDTDKMLYFKNEGKGWKVNYDYYYPTHKNNEEINIKIYQIDQQFLVYVILTDNQNIANVKDNNEEQFELLHSTNYFNYKIHNRYIKLIDDISKYEIYYNDKKIDFLKKEKDTSN